MCGCVFASWHGPLHGRFGTLSFLNSAGTVSRTAVLPLVGIGCGGETVVAPCNTLYAVRVFLSLRPVNDCYSACGTQWNITRPPSARERARV